MKNKKKNRQDIPQLPKDQLTIKEKFDLTEKQKEILNTALDNKVLLS
jgi:hypothetical protein